MSYKDYKHRTRIQVRYKDVDMQGHVNNANHLTYFEMARVDYFRDVIAERNDWQRTGMILARVEVDYRLPVTLDDEVYCYSKVSQVGNKSFTISNATVKKQGDELKLCAEGKTVVVCYNYELQKTIAIPEQWKEAVEKYENGK